MTEYGSVYLKIRFLPEDQRDDHFPGALKEKLSLDHQIFKIPTENFGEKESIDG